MLFLIIHFCTFSVAFKDFKRHPPHGFWSRWSCHGWDSSGPFSNIVNQIQTQILLVPSYWNKKNFQFWCWRYHNPRRSHFTLLVMVEVLQPRYNNPRRSYFTLSIMVEVLQHQYYTNTFPNWKNFTTEEGWEIVKEKNQKK